MTSPSKKKKPAPKDLQLAELSKGLDPAEVKKRPQGSGSVSYVTGEYIKRTLNRIFGFSNWSSEIVEMCCQDDSGGPWARARVKLEVVFADGVKVAREDVGFGSASPKQRDGRELAGKEAVTDGIKRAASSLGNQFGGVVLNMIQWPQKNKAANFQRTDLDPAPYADKTFRDTVILAERCIRDLTPKHDTPLAWPGVHHEHACWTAYGPCDHYDTCTWGTQ